MVSAGPLFVRGGAVAGIASALLWIAATIGAPSKTPSSNATAAEVVTYFSENGAQLRIAVFVLGLSLAFLLWFAAVLRDRMGEHGAGSAPVARLAFGAWLLFIGLDFVALALYPGLLASDSFTSTAEPELVRTWYWLVRGVEPGLWEIVAVGSTFALAVAFAATSSIALRGGGLPRWLGWFAVVVAVGFASATLETLGGAVRDVAGALGYLTYFLLFRLWLVAAGVALLVRSWKEDAQVPDRPGIA